MSKLIAVVWACVACGSASGQSLLRRAAAPASEPRAAVANDELRATSMMYIDPPRARTFQVHDQITIIVDETSRQSSSQSLETKTDAKLAAALQKLPSLKHFLEGELKTGESAPIVEAAATSKDNWKGEGEFSRTDRLNARITATVIDVKPNGVLVLEARKTIESNSERQVFVLSGSCRKDDVTNANTVLSSQLAGLTVSSRSEGDVEDAASKGWITRVLDAVFDF